MTEHKYEHVELTAIDGTITTARRVYPSGLFKPDYIGGGKPLDAVRMAKYRWAFTPEEPF